MRYVIQHRTEYRFVFPVSTGHQRLHLTPRALPGQTVHASSVEVTPGPSFRVEREDSYGNLAIYVEIEEPHDHLSIVAKSCVEVEAPPPPPDDTPPWEEVRKGMWGAPSTQALEAMEFAVASPYVRSASALADFARPSFPDGRPLLDGVMDLTLRIHDEFRFEPEATDITTPVTEVLERKRGVCQDFAHLEIACLRALGLSARYVSGYLRTDPPPGQPRLVGADASHAWVSVHCPGAGWFDYDPTNGCVRADRHVVLGWGRDFGDVSPVKGHLVAAGPHELEVAVDVVPEDELAPAEPGKAPGGTGNRPSA